MKINESYELDILIDGASISRTSGVVFISADIYEALMNPIPTCKLELSVPTGWINERSIIDGTEIKFVLTAKQFDMKSEYIFRLFNIQQITINQKFAQICLEGVIDFYQGYLEGNQFNLFGNTSDVFKNIANKTGLKHDIDSTNDAQTWVAGENNIYQFFSWMAQRGWINETSAMFWCIDRHGILLYKNLTALFRERQDKIWRFSQNGAPDLKDKRFTYDVATASVQAGTNNLKNEGYGGTDYYFDSVSYKWQSIAARKVVAESNLINISKELSQGLYKNWYPFDVGNFHPNYELAYKQNKRILSTYSSYVTLQCSHFQPARIGQIVNFEFLDSQDITNIVTCLSGTYIIDAMHITMTPTDITSVVEIAMQGLNGKAITREVY